MAANWLRRFLPAHGERVRIAGIVDVNADVLATARHDLGLAESQCFTTMEAAFDTVDADAVAIVVPPKFHRDAIEHACRRGLPILSEKPISDTFEGVQAIVRAVDAAGVPVAIMQNYRQTPRIQTLKRLVDSGRVGAIRYAVARFAADYREPLSWGAPFRHEMRHALLVEGSIHHFDQIRHLTGQDCLTIAGHEWNPGAPSFKGECLGLYVMQMTGGVFAQYEGSGLAGGWQNTWHGEAYRLECEGGAIVLDRDHVVRVQEHVRGRGMRVEEVPTVTMPHESHAAVIGIFMDWLDGGAAPQTTLADNLQSTAMLFGAIEASATGATVDVQALVKRARSGGDH
jgi:predicted dehydrogenase